MAHKNIIDFKTGDTVSGTYVLKVIQESVTSTGKPYLKLVLSDDSGDIPGNKWEMPATAAELVQGGLVDVTMTIREYKDALQANVESICNRDLKDLEDREGVIPMSPETPERMYERIVNLANTFTDEELKKIVLTALAEKKDGLLVTPAAMKMHQAVVGGLLWHITGMLKIANGLTKVYPEVNRELLFAGIILHDFGKMEEFSLSPIGLVQDYSETGQLEGHLYMGALYVRGLCEKLSVTEEKRILLEHMILSHHMKPEWGAVQRPQTMEAYLLHICDEIDAKMFQFNEILKTLEPGQFSRLPGNRDDIQKIYKPKL